MGETALTIQKEDRGQEHENQPTGTFIFLTLIHLIYYYF